MPSLWLQGWRRSVSQIWAGKWVTITLLWKPPQAKHLISSSWQNNWHQFWAARRFKWFCVNVSASKKHGRAQWTWIYCVMLKIKKLWQVTELIKWGGKLLSLMMIVFFPPQNVLMPNRKNRVYHKNPNNSLIITILGFFPVSSANSKSDMTWMHHQQDVPSTSEEELISNRLEEWVCSTAPLPQLTPCLRSYSD